MNRRIRELMEGLFDVSVDHRGREECTADFTNIEKFAGLIVRELEWDQESKDWMRKHFVGVEP